MTTNDDLNTNKALPVLRRMTHEQLEVIVKFLNKAWDVFIKDSQRYQAAKQNLTHIPDVIDEFIRRAGGSVFANFHRGMDYTEPFTWGLRVGPPYAEVVRDACEALSVDIKGCITVPEMEVRLLQVLTARVWDKMSEAEREEMIRRAEAVTGKAREAAEGARGNMGAMPFAVLVVAVGNQIATYLSIQISLQILNFLASRLIGGGIALAADGVIAGVVGAFLGPIGIAAGAIWAIVDVTGPSIRATAPAVFQIALMRQTFLWEDALA